jgi:hypothetical protein
MPAVGSTNYPALEKILARLGAERPPEEVHALFLGALTSTSLRLGPQHILGHIFGDLSRMPMPSMTNLGQVLGYWNHLLEERTRGKVRLAPRRLSAAPTADELRAYAAHRGDELLWFVRGIDAGGDDPVMFGPEGEMLLRKIAEASGFLGQYVEALGSGEQDAQQLRDTRESLLGLVETVEGLISDLMDLSDAVRREAMRSHAVMEGRMTDDGVRIGGSPRVARNAVCPCGSGKKWKKCCGSAVQPQ